MKPAAFERARAIQIRLDHITRHRTNIQSENWVVRALELGCDTWTSEAKVESTAPAHVHAFRRACLDALATEEAALRAEFDAL